MVQRDKLRVHLQLIDRDVAAFASRHRASIQCHRGCGECCHQTFKVSKPEGALLQAALARLPAKQRAEVLARARAYQPDRRDPCPLLGPDHACLTYDDRPRICRKYGVPLWHPDRPHELRSCRLNFCEGEDLAEDGEAWVEAQAAWAMDWIELRRGQGPAVNQSIAHWLTQPG